MVLTRSSSSRACWWQVPQPLLVATLLLHLKNNVGPSISSLIHQSASYAYEGLHSGLRANGLYSSLLEIKEYSATGFIMSRAQSKQPIPSMGDLWGPRVQYGGPWVRIIFSECGVSGTAMG